MNVELVKHYMGLTKKIPDIKEVAYFDIIKELNQKADSWNWELEDEKIFEIAGEKRVMTTVTVYLPGRISTGRSVCKLSDYHNNHLFAILDACSWFITSKTNSTVNPSPCNIPSNNTPNQMTPDEIMSMVQQPQQQTIDNQAQFYNYKENGMPSQEVPFDKMTDNCHNEMQQSLMETPQEVPQQISDYDKPQERLKGFSQHQIDRMNQFKKDFEILNDEMFGNYVNTWNDQFTSKKDITPNNVESFLSWVEQLGKMDC